jgi:zinc transport system permease protein
MSLLSLEFMQRAIIAALLTGLAAPAIGIFIVQRRQALIGDGIGHVALTGVGLGLLTGGSPVITAVLVATAGAVVMELLRHYRKTSADVALAILFYGGIAGGVLITSLSGNTAATLNTYLFGSITTVSSTDLWVVVALTFVVLLCVFGFARQLFALCQDEEFARVAGLPVRAYGILLAVLAAVTVTLSMRTVGLLLVSALMVVPVAAAQQLSRAFRVTFVIAVLIGVAAALVGVVLSYYVDVPSGPSIVLLSIAMFALSWPAGALVQRRTSARRLPTPTPS